jgi:2-methylisocitrate lyase-like PEP mutase family enzyme
MTTNAVFCALHEQGLFVMPNPWDLGSARMLQELGFPALATTSAGLGRALGKDDQQVTRDELVAHVGQLTAFLDVPLSVDSECLFPDDPGGIAETVRLLAGAGAAGCSIEDYRPRVGSILPVDEATDAVAVAVEACRAHDVVLTARAENAVYGVDDLDDTITRLTAYREAGADVVYAPRLLEEAAIARIVTEVGGPVNVLAMPGAPAVDRLAELGVRRVSSGGWLFVAAYDTLRTEARRLLPDPGTGSSAGPR